MDHKALHIAKAIIQRKLLNAAAEPEKEDLEELVELEALPEEEPADPKQARKERLKAILAR